MKKFRFKIILSSLKIDKNEQTESYFFRQRWSNQ
jgi:hypothetical protein